MWNNQVRKNMEKQSFPVALRLPLEGLFVGLLLRKRYIVDREKVKIIDKLWIF